MSRLEFTEEAAWQLERLYLTRDLVAQRSETMKFFKERRKVAITLRVWPTGLVNISAEGRRPLVKLEVPLQILTAGRPVEASATGESMCKNTHP